MPVRLIDLPAANRLADDEDHVADGAQVRTDPLGVLAAAAGQQDPERWWEDLIEHRRDELSAFEAVGEAMAALREDQPPESEAEARREAHMRQRVRAALKEGARRVAVVCGAWHVPAIAELGAAAPDARLLKGLPKRKVATTWVPWTYDRLSYASGYGAGVPSPGWYDHLFTTEDDVVVRWLAKTAALLRAEDVDVSSAQLIEAARTAAALAAVRGRPLAGLSEVTEAVEAVLGEGADGPLALIHDRLVVGEVLGEVPESTPVVPLQADVSHEQKRLRLKPEAGARRLDLDLRKPNERARSHLLHRLALLGVHWGQLEQATGKRGTFHELWEVQWAPEYAVRLIEASMWGTTLPAAATAFASDAASRADDLATLTGLVEATLLADLPEATAMVMRAFDHRAAVEGDTAALMDALPPLARVLRYGTVRETDASAVAVVVDGLIARICVGLPGAVSALDDQAAETIIEEIDGVHAAVALLERDDLRATWERELAALADRDDVHGLVVGRALRLVFDAGRVASEEAARRMSLALSPGADPGHAAAWTQGFLSGSGIVLLHDDALLGVLDRWVGEVSDDGFERALPVLRRTFATFAPAERRRLGQRLRGGARPAAPGREGDAELDHDRATQVLPLLTRVLGASG